MTILVALILFAVSGLLYLAAVGLVDEPHRSNLHGFRIFLLGVASSTLLISLVGALSR